MTICVLHGYLLEGSGSNVYVQNLVRAYCKQGHHVILFCQERKLKKYDFVHTYFQFNKDNQSFKRVFKKKTLYKGNCDVYNPAIGPLIPVFVKDHYEFFKHVKEFHKLNKKQIDAYINRNVTALKTILRRHSVDLVDTHHLIMNSFVAMKALTGTTIPYRIFGHGSALNFSIKKSLLLKRYATEALTHASFVNCSSTYFKTLVKKEFKQIRGLAAKLHTIPCGVDVDKFKTVQKIPPPHLNALLQSLKSKLKSHPHGKSKKRKKYEMHHPDQSVIEEIKKIKWGKERVLLYVGKFMKTKGPQVALAAFANVIKQFPESRLLLVGYGRYREKLEAKVHALPKSTQSRIHFTGLLEHTELSHLLPLVDIMLIPSLFPESFGMIVAEGFSSAVPTLVTYQSALKDMHDIMATECRKRGVKLKRTALNKSLVSNLSHNINLIFKKNLSRNVTFKKSLRHYAVSHFSWKKIAQVLIKS